MTASPPRALPSALPPLSPTTSSSSGAAWPPGTPSPRTRRPSQQTCPTSPTSPSPPSAPQRASSPSLSGSSSCAQPSLKHIPSLDVDYASLDADDPTLPLGTLSSLALFGSTTARRDDPRYRALAKFRTVTLQHGVADLPLREYLRALRVHAAATQRRNRRTRRAFKQHPQNAPPLQRTSTPSTRRPHAGSDPPPEPQVWPPSDDELFALPPPSHHDDIALSRRRSLPEPGPDDFAHRHDLLTRRRDLCSRFEAAKSVHIAVARRNWPSSTSRPSSFLPPRLSLSRSFSTDPPPATALPEHVQLVYHMLRHAESIYGFSINVPSAPATAVTKVTDRGIVIGRTGLSRADFCAVSFSTTTFMPAHYVAVDRQIKAIVVCIRGTAHVMDSLTDVAATQDPLSMRRDASGSRDASESDDGDIVQGHGHAGVLRSARNLFHRIRKPVLLALKEHPGFELMLTGHSLGAATAAVLALIMRDDPEFPRALAFAFAPLPCLTYELAELTSSFTVTVINGPDIVPRLSVALLLPYFSTARYVADLSRSRKALLALGLKNAAINWDELETFNAKRVKELKKEHEGRRLYIPGKVFQLVRKSEVPRKDAVRNRLFRRRDVEVVAVSRTQFLHVRGRERGMFVSHAPFTYKKSLALALRGMGTQPLRAMTGGRVVRNLLTVPVASLRPAKGMAGGSLETLLQRIGDKSLDNLMQDLEGR